MTPSARWARLAWEAVLRKGGVAARQKPADRQMAAKKAPRKKPAASKVSTAEAAAKKRAGARRCCSVAQGKTNRRRSCYAVPGHERHGC
jgi:hypothetical protein